jgi:hypothetical protein
MHSATEFCKAIIATVVYGGPAIDHPREDYHRTLVSPSFLSLARLLQQQQQQKRTTMITAVASNNKAPC